MNDFEIIKQGLDPRFVMEEIWGETLQSNGRYYAPWRQDNTPGVDIYWSDKAGCWKIDDSGRSRGDVVDMLTWNGQSLADAWPMLAEQTRSPWVTPDAPARRPFEPGGYEGASDSLQAALGSHYHHHTPSGGVVSDEAPTWLEGTEAWYNSEWRIRASGTSLVIPYFDGADELVAYKTRPVAGRKLNGTGSKLCLYGLWRLDAHSPIIVCEGETDTWSASIAFPDVISLGVPGASHDPASLGAAELAGREVALAFDGDAAGREATTKWFSYLHAAGCRVSVVSLPDGKDISDLPKEAFKEAYDRRRFPSPRPEGITRLNDQYRGPTTDKGPGKEFSNWALDVHRVLVGDSGEQAFEGTLLPTRKPVVLPADTLTSAAKLTQWSARNGVAWLGGGQDHSKLFAMLQHESLALPTGRMTNKAGFHGGDWVWPGGHFGQHDWTYVPPVADIGLDTMLSMRSGPAPDHQLHMLVDAYDHSVTTPFLGWLAASFLRPLFDTFPILFVSGTSGAGKTTLSELLVPAMTGGLIETNLTSTTPHALAAFFSSSSSYPVWFDEYRPGMKKETKQLFDQMLRDSYNGKRSSKGGQTSNLSAVTSFDTAVPVIVSGEDSMIETSLVDRSILLRLNRDLRGTIVPYDYGLAPAFMAFLSDALGSILRGGSIGVRPEDGEHLSDRLRANLGVIRYGYELLQEFVGGAGLPELDMSMALGQAEESSLTSPLDDALNWALDNGLHCAFIDDDGCVNVQAAEFLREVKRADIFTLPVSNVQGVTSYFRDKYRADNVRVRHLGNQIRVIRFAYDVVN